MKKEDYSSSCLLRYPISIMEDLVKTLHELSVDLEPDTKDLFNEQINTLREKDAAKPNRQKIITKLIRHFLKKGVNVNAINSAGRTPLHEAVWHDNLITTKMLIENKADINQKIIPNTTSSDFNNFTPLHLAVFNENLIMVMYLLHCGAYINVVNDKDGNILHSAYKLKDIRILKYLIDHGADLNAKNPQGNTLLHRTFYDNNIELLKFLVDKGADINAKDNDNYTVLHLALHKGNLELIEYLVDKGANPDVDYEDCTKNTPLHRISQLYF